jgi:DNA-binding NtrC family response regulator
MVDEFMESENMATTRKTRILIIDDEELICWCLKKSFERNKEYSVSCAYTASEALKNIAEKQFDIVITDLKLPDVDGLELLEKITSLNTGTPVIVMSAYLTDPAMTGVDEYDVFSCVNKPFDISDVMRGVREALESGLNNLCPESGIRNQ